MYWENLKNAKGTKTLVKKAKEHMCNQSPVSYVGEGGTSKTNTILLGRSRNTREGDD